MGHEHRPRGRREAFTFKNFWKNDQGVTAIMTALSLSTLVAVGTIAVAVSVNESRKQEVQRTIDAAVLSAATDAGIWNNSSKLTSYFNQYIQSTVPPDLVRKIKAKSISLKTNAEGMPEINAELTFDGQALAGPLSTRDTLTVRSAALPRGDGKPADVAFVIDNSGSAGSYINDLKTAASSFVVNVAGFGSQISIVPFNMYVRVGLDEADGTPSWLGPKPANWKGLVGVRPRTDSPTETNPDTLTSLRRLPGTVRPGETIVPYPALGYNPVSRLDQEAMSNGSTLRPILPLTSDISRLESYISDLKTGGATYTNAGLIWGWQTLTQAAPFSQAKSGNSKSMVLFSDGGTSNGYGGFDVGTLGAATDQDKYTDLLTICSNIKAAKIKLFVVYYPVGATDPARVENTLKECAGEENFYKVNSADKIKDALMKIKFKVLPLVVLTN